VAVFRVVLDVNVVVSGLMTVSGAPQQIFLAVQRGDVAIIVSPTFLAELHDVLHRPKFRRWFSVAVASRTVIEIRRAGESYPDPAPTAAVTRDPGDDYLVRLARAARADCLVTGDSDLLEADLADVWVLAPGAFLRELQAPAAPTMEHFFYTPDESSAAALQAGLQAEGLLATFQPSASDDGQWLVMTYTDGHDEDGMEHFQQLAAQHGAEYDGSGTYMGPLELLLPPEER
jgi:putative PIN family toxin of toxin-antitoxin system